MILIIPIVICLMLVAALLSFLAITIAVKAASISVSNLPTESRRIFLREILIAGGGIASVIVWFALGEIDSTAIDATLDLFLKVAISATAASIVMLVAGFAVKATAYGAKKSNFTLSSKTLTGSAILGLLTGYCVVFGLGYSLDKALPGPQVTDIHFDRPATHCVTEDTRMLSASNRYATSTRTVMTLQTGERFQLDPYITFRRGERSMHAFRIFYDDGRERIVYARPNFMKPLAEVGNCSAD